MIVHIIGNRRVTLCQIRVAGTDTQFCPVRMWPALNPEYKCPECDRIILNCQRIVDEASSADRGMI